MTTLTTFTFKMTGCGSVTVGSGRQLGRASVGANKHFPLSQSFSHTKLVSRCGAGGDNSNSAKGNFYVRFRLDPSEFFSEFVRLHSSDVC